MQIKYKRSKILTNFLNFEIDCNILENMQNLKIDNIKKLENYLEILIPEEDKKLNGAFFTPKDIVDFIIKEVKPTEKDKCLDPSCGCGAFFIGLIEYYQIKFNKSIKDILKENIFGFDILEYNIRRTKLLISIYALLQNEIIEEADFNIFNKDSLNEKIDDSFDVIIGNPPYIKYQDMEENNRKLLLSNWQTTQKGTFNIYFAFFELGYKLLKENGRVGFITPNNYFTSLSAEPLREYLSSNKSIYKIINFKDIKIFDVQTYTALTFLNKNSNSLILYDRIESKDYREFLLNLKFSENYIDNLNNKKWRLLKSNEQNNIRIIENIGTPIKELFDISASIATLKDEVYIIDGKTLNKEFYKKQTDNGIFYIEKEVVKPVYKVSKFKTQTEIDKNSDVIIFPYIIKGKKAIPIQENEFKAKYPKCYEYLVSEKEVLSKRDKGKKPKIPFYLWGRTQGIAKIGKKILNPTFSEKPRFLTVLEDGYFTNGYGIFFNKEQENNLFNKVSPFSLESNIYLVQKILNSKIMDYYIKKTSVLIQGGFPCYQKNFIENFTIPKFSKIELEELNGLSDNKDIDNFLIQKYNFEESSLLI